MRFYIKPRLYGNISDSHTWTIVRKKGQHWVGDSIKPLFFGLWVSKIPKVIAEPNKGCWYELRLEK